MGQALIDSGGENGLYDITIVKDAGRSSSDLAQINARLVTLTVEISTAQATLAAEISELGAAQAALNAAIADMDGTADKRKAVTDAQGVVLSKQADVTQARAVLARLVASQSSLNSRKSIIESAMVAESRAGVWCADFTEDLTPGESVGTIEINGVDTQIILMPGGDKTEALGKLQHSGISTGAGVFVNKALLPCWQKWKPTYRIGTVIDVDFEENTCTVGIAEQYSGEQGLTINQSGVVWDETSDSVPGFDDFADRYPSFPLVTNTGDTNLTMTPALMADMAAVQADVQNRFKYRTDAEQFNTLENWDFMQEGGSGDCEDHCLTKAKKLLDLGYPASAIKIEVGQLPSGGGHAWLVVQTDKGDYALDNNYQNVIKASSLPYSNRRRQTGTTWGSRGVKLSDVPIEYMDGVDSSVFVAGDRVVVAFEGQDWTKPKVIGFEANPKPGYIMVSFVNDHYTSRRFRKYSLGGDFTGEVASTVSNNAMVSVGSNKSVTCFYSVINDLFGAHMTLTIDQYSSSGPTSIVYDLWQGYVSEYFAAITKPYCTVHHIGNVFFDAAGLLYIPIAIYGGEFLIYSLIGFIAVNPTTGTLIGEYWHNYGGSIFAFPSSPSGGCIADSKVYLADISDGINGYPIVRILDESDYHLDSTISLGGKMDTYASSVFVTENKIYAVYFTISYVTLKIFDQTTKALLKTVALKSVFNPNFEYQNSSIFAVAGSIIIMLVLADSPSTTTRYEFDFDGTLKSEKALTYVDYERNFSLTVSNLI